MVIIEATPFTRHLSAYMNDAQYREFQGALCDQPEMGAVIPDSGGYRKLRWSDPRRGKGKRGGLRVIYYYFEAAQQHWLLTIYDKDTQDDLTKAQRQALKQMLEDELAARQKKNQRRR
jgi:hypothetical protein